MAYWPPFELSMLSPELITGRMIVIVRTLKNEIQKVEELEGTTKKLPVAIREVMGKFHRLDHILTMPKGRQAEKTFPARPETGTGSADPH